MQISQVIKPEKAYDPDQIPNTILKTPQLLVSVKSVKDLLHSSRYPTLKLAYGERLDRFQEARQTSIGKLSPHLPDVHPVQAP